MSVPQIQHGLPRWVRHHPRERKPLFRRKELLLHPA
jgi:hypothetical protein